MRVAAIIIKDNKMLLMHRFKNNEEYFTLLGGSVEDGEDLEQALVREIKEESNLEISGLEFLWQLDNRGREDNYFLVKNFSGDLKLGEPELSRQNENNKYIPTWVNLSDLKDIDLRPVEVKEKILEKFVK
jgi:ADP-ribose pyrophosphatase YjhB (NUDIX family)